MDSLAFSSSCSGKIVAIPSGSAFLPNDLPPTLTYSNKLLNAFGASKAAVEKLDVAVPEDVNAYLVGYPLMLREALYSSRMEGTHTTPKDLVLFDLQKDEDPDTREVRNYVTAMEFGLERIADGLGIGHSLIKSLHRALLDGVRGKDKDPGRYRSVQNFIGREFDGVEGARFVPPPPSHVPALMDALESYIRTIDASDDSLPLLIDLALIHYQFETIHPFNDGNGRIGRLLIPLTLIHKKRITKPLLYVSAYLEKNKEEYNERMFRVSTKGEWEEWVLFFLRALEMSAKESLSKTKSLLALRARYRELVTTPRASALMVDLVESLFKNPKLTIGMVQERLGISQPQASAYTRRLERLGIIEEQTGGKRNLQFIATEVVAVAVG